MAPACQEYYGPDSIWSFCPSLGASIFFTILFAAAATAQAIQGVYHRKLYTWVVTMGALWQTTAYVVRDISISSPDALTPYAVWIVFLMVAPIWTNAYVYMVMGRMVWNFTSNAGILGLKAWRFGIYFVIVDIVAAAIQLYGAGSAQGSDLTYAQTMRGLHWYMGGVGIQQLCILVFLAFAIQFHRIILREHLLPPQTLKAVLKLQYTLYIVLAAISCRIIFRICEYSKGVDSAIPNHEAYQYCFDSLPMLACFVLLSIVHPAQIMPGKASDIPSRKERKAKNILFKTSEYRADPEAKGTVEIVNAEPNKAG